MSLDDLTEEQLEEAMASDDPDELAKLMGEDTGESDPSAQPKGEQEPQPKEPEPDPEPKAKEPEPDPAPEPKKEPEPKDPEPKGGEPDPKGDDPGGEPSTQRPEGVLMKDGRHVAPYSVLEAERARRQEIEKELSEYKSKLPDLEGKSQRMAELLKEQGVDLDAIEQGKTLDEKALKAIHDADPDIAKAIGHLQTQLQTATTKLDQLESRESATPVDLAIQSNPDLNEWFNSEESSAIDRRTLAIRHDDMLKSHPEWKSQPLSKRFAEAVRLTKLEFGDAVSDQKGDNSSPDKDMGGKTAEQLAAEKVAAAKSKQAPTSLTDLGSQPSADAPLTERVAAMSDAQLDEFLSTATPEQLDQIEMDALYGSQE